MKAGARLAPWGAALVAAALLGGCAGAERAPEPAPAAAIQIPQPPAGARKGPAPIPVRALNVKADCSFRDPTGYRGTLRLEVAEARVERFEAAVTTSHGSCRFRQADFRQTQGMPNPVLKANNGSRCEVLLWEQGRRVTVAFSDCRDMCSSRAAFERLWPILADAGSGECG